MSNIGDLFLPIVIVRNGMITDYNEIFTEQIGFTQPDIEDNQLQNILVLVDEHKQQDLTFKQFFSEVSLRESGVLAMGTIKNKYRYGLPVRVHCQSYEGGADSFKLCFQILNNKCIDPITRLPNGWAITSKADYLLHTQGISLNNFVLIILNVDNFSTINFRYGFDVGDDFLSTLGEKLQEIVKKNDLVTRFSNAKFGMLIENHDKLTSEAFNRYIVQICQKLCDLSATPLWLNDSLKVGKSFSIGVSEQSGGYNNYHAMEIAAETAMIQAKKYSVSRYCLSTTQTIDDLLSKKLIIDELPYAIEQNKINIHYQPQYEINTGELIGFEALSRWNHDTLGNITPDVFVGIAEEIGLHFELDLWVCTQVCSQVVNWQKQGLNIPRIAINISFKTLEMTTFTNRLINIIKKTKCPTMFIELEITETTSAKDIKTLTDNILEVKKLGIHIAVDDFGAGYSSLSLIRKLHLSLDKLKLDRTLIENICRTTIDREFTRQIIKLSKVLNVKVLAEGVEDLEQFDLLKLLGCDYAQGYYFDKALSKIEAEQLIDNKMVTTQHPF
jgi:diguanylate cyclase (GGDEF)-like protein